MTDEFYFDNARSFYNEDGRYYHTWEHIETMISGMYDFLPLPEYSDVDWVNLVAAITFHDAVYDPLSQSNEELSARLAEKHLVDECGWAPEIAANVGTLIRGTSRNYASDSLLSSPTFRVLNDLDYAVFASGVGDAYSKYALNVAKEFIGAGVSMIDYLDGRRYFLTSIINNSPFMTPLFADDKMYVVNAKYEIAVLSDIVKQAFDETRSKDVR